MSGPAEGAAGEQGEAAAGGPDADRQLPEGVPWYIEGLRFECTACGKCCKNHGDGYEYVFSTRAERKRIASHLGLSLRAFEAEYTTKVAGRLSFTFKGDACVFLEDGKCSIYAFRPLQCSTFPFWPELLEDRDTWEKDVASFCPGAGQGTLHDVAEIRAVAAKFGG